jgi:hypothetical protein
MEQIKEQLAKFEDVEITDCHPESLDRIVQQLGPAAVIEGSAHGNTCTVRCFANSAGFIKFAIDHQGYGKVVAG